MSVIDLTKRITELNDQIRKAPQGEERVNLFKERFKCLVELNKQRKG